MTMLVTGGAGFIGCNFVREALSQGISDIIVLDALAYSGKKENLQEILNKITFIHGDITNSDLISSLYRKFSPTVIVNFAAESHVDRSIQDPFPFVSTNVLGTINLLECARKLLKNYKFIQISTDEVYGSLGPTGRFTEDTPFAPNSPYSASKGAADLFARAYFSTYDLPILTTHCSNNYGPFQHPEKFIPTIILSALSGKPVPVYGDGLNIRDWIYVKDHCSAILKVIEKGQVGERYNIGSNCEATNLQIINLIFSLLNEVLPKKDYEIIFIPDRPGHDRRYAIDSTKISTELSWTPSYSLKEGLRKTISWYLQSCPITFNNL